MIRRRATRYVVSTRREKMIDFERLFGEMIHSLFREIGRGYMETLTLVWYETFLSKKLFERV